MSEPRQPAILVVEDQDAVRIQVARALELAGYSVIQAADGEEGLSILHHNQGCVDLAIVDFVMPGMSGLDMAAELIREHPDVKILYISANPGSVAMEVMTHSSPETVIARPFTTAELIRRVHLLLEARPGTLSPTFP